MAVGDVIYIEANSGAVKRVGRCDAYATEFDLEAEEYVPLPKARLMLRAALSSYHGITTNVSDGLSSADWMSRLYSTCNNSHRCLLRMDYTFLYQSSDNCRRCSARVPIT